MVFMSDARPLKIMFFNLISSAKFVCVRVCVCQFPVDARLPRMSLAGVRGQRMCVTATSSLPVMPALTRLVLHRVKQTFIY